MKSNQSLHEKYPDFLGSDPDPRLARLVADLDTVSTSPQPPDHLSASIERTLIERSVNAGAKGTKPPWTHRLRVWRPTQLRFNVVSAIAVVLVAVLVLTGAAYAVAPLLSSIFKMEQGLQHIDESKLGQEVRLSQTINGWTVTVERVYADANRIVVGYTASGPQVARSINAHCSSLRDDKGTTFPAMTGVGNSDGTSTLATVSSFDAGALSDPPRVLNLTLSCGVQAIGPVEDIPTPDAQSSNTDPMTARAEAKRAEVQEVAGPFTFNFSVPVITARIAEVGRTVEAAGYAITLERVVVTPSETRAILRYEATNGSTPSEGAPIVTLRIDGRVRGGDTMTGGHKVGGDGKIAHHIYAPLYDEQGEWSLTVTELVLWPQIEEGISDQIRISGPWTFNFTLPAPLQD